MKAFTIDTENNITVHASRKAARETGAGVFATEEQFADLIGPDNKRLVEIWNGIAGVRPVTKFANRKAATERIWKAIQSLGEQAPAPLPETPFDAPGQDVAPADLPVAEPEHADAEASHPLEDASLRAEVEPVSLSAPDAAEATPVTDAGAQEPLGAPADAEASETAARAKKTTKAKKEPKAPKAPKPPKPAKSEESTGPREGSKTARVVEMLKREGGASLEEIMQQTGWQKHTVRGFMAGAMKKAGYTVESFKSDKGERSYRINQ